MICHGPSAETCSVCLPNNPHEPFPSSISPLHHSAKSTPESLIRTNLWWVGFSNGILMHFVCLIGMRLGGRILGCACSCVNCLLIGGLALQFHFWSLFPIRASPPTAEALIKKPGRSGFGTGSELPSIVDRSDCSTTPDGGWFVNMVRCLHASYLEKWKNLIVQTPKHVLITIIFHKTGNVIRLLN